MSKLEDRDYTKSPETSADKKTLPDDRGTLLSLLSGKRGLILAILLASGSALNCQASCDFAGCKVLEVKAEEDNLRVRGCGCNE